MSLQNLSEADLQALFAKDAEKAIEVLFEQYYSYLCQAVYKILPDAAIVEDLVQEVFFELWRRRDKVQISTTFRAYLRRAAVNKTLNYIRDQKIKFADEPKEWTLSAYQIEGQEKLEVAELQQLIDESIDSLPERCRMVFVLSRFEDYSYQQIADELGISVKTVENQISKALKILRDRLGSHL